MTVRNLRFTSKIHGPAETIFDVVADMPNYGRWHRNSPLRFVGRTVKAAASRRSPNGKICGRIRERVRCTLCPL
jgi:hypothetical protein